MLLSDCSLNKIYNIFGCDNVTIDGYTLTIRLSMVYQYRDLSVDVRNTTLKEAKDQSYNIIRDNYIDCLKKLVKRGEANRFIFHNEDALKKYNINVLALLND